jgi:hypothetical protein
MLKSSAILCLIVGVAAAGYRTTVSGDRCGGAPGHTEGHGLALTDIASGLGQVHGVLGRIWPVGRFTLFPISIMD